MEKFLFLALAFGIVVLGLLLFFKECRDAEIPWKTIIPFTIIVGALLILALVIASK